VARRCEELLSRRNVWWNILNTIQRWCNWKGSVMQASVQKRCYQQLNL
jgi:hypothetical protein